MKFKGLLKVALLLVAVSALFVACDTLAGGRFPHVETVYMKPGEDWASDKPVYAAWMWTDGKEGSWTELTKSTIEDDLWEVAVPSEIDNIIFVKMKDGTTKDKFSWDNKEEQTGDLKVPYVFDNVQVYSIKAKEWIAIGAEEKEPELEEVDSSVITHICGFDDWSKHVELVDNAYTFVATNDKVEFKFTTGKWEGDDAFEAFGCTIGENQFGTEVDVKLGKCGVDGRSNIKIKGLELGSEYKITYIIKTETTAAVKVEATGKTETIKGINITAEQFATYKNVAGKIMGWNKDLKNLTTESSTVKSFEFTADGTGTEFKFTDGSWDFVAVTPTITALNKEYPVMKTSTMDNIVVEGCLEKNSIYKVTLTWKDNQAFVKIVDTGRDYVPPANPFENKLTTYVGTMNNWSGHNELDANNSFEFFALGIGDEFKFTTGAWDVFEGGTAYIKALDTKYELQTKQKDTVNIAFDTGVLTRNSGYKVTLVIEGGKAYVTVSANDKVNPNPYESIETKTIYFTPDSNWKDAGARFAVKFITKDWASQSAFYEMTDKDSDGIYEVVVVPGYTQVVFIRMNPGRLINDWDSKWNQTIDIDLPTDGKVLYTIENPWDNELEGKAHGSWSTLQ